MSEIEQKEELSRAYEPREVEDRIYQFWSKKGYFTPKIDRSKKPFVIIMPPPNVTGELHLGHALTATLEDIMTRWHRMKGEITLWLPGADHAGIATQVVVEQQLAKEGLTRYDLGREKFVERVWQWVSGCRGTARSSWISPYSMRWNWMPSSSIRSVGIPMSITSSSPT